MNRRMDAETAAEHALGTPIDLEACRTEPIHLLGSVQSHGVLIAVDDEPDLTIRTVSANSGRMLGREPDALLGRPLTDLLGTEQSGLLQQATAALDAGESALLPIVIDPTPGRGAGTATFDLTVHRTAALLVCEFERAERDEPFRLAPFLLLVRRALRHLQDAATVLDLADRTASEVRELTGYDRVVVYRFDGEGPGHVIAEDRHPDWESWLDLWFPAIDVPPQARRLYLRNWIRSVADVDDVPVPLLPAPVPGTNEPLDLSGSVLRSLSHYHIEYLRNIGVAASMSISLIKDGRLWGLVACHHGRPLRLSAEIRSACEFLGAALSTQLAAIEQREESAARAQATAALARLAATPPSGFSEFLLRADPNPLDMIPAGGACLRLGNTISTRGSTPPGPEIIGLLDRLPLGPAGTVWCTDDIGSIDPDLTRLAETASGILVLSLTRSGDGIAWFRPEASATVRWAADPARPVVMGSHGQRLTPRGSHAVWRETVRGRSRPWQASEQELATLLGRLVIELLLNRTAELGELVTELRRRNAELDSFAYVTAHDLREPLRGISTSAEFALEDSPDLDPGTVRRLHTIRRLAVRMDELLTTLLTFSQVGRGSMAAEPVDMTTLADEVVDVVGDRAREANVELRRPQPLPPALGDGTLLREVLTNLVVNAVKYSGDEPRWVEIGNARTTPPQESGPIHAFYVRDNGIGIAPELHEEVFRLFRRIGPDQGSGLGVGLATARKIVEQHGGQLWVQSDSGSGSTFWFTLPGTGTTS